MKKKSLKSLVLKKEVVAKIDVQQIKGGVRRTVVTAGKKCKALM